MSEIKSRGYDSDEDAPSALFHLGPLPGLASPSDLAYVPQDPDLPALNLRVEEEKSGTVRPTTEDPLAGFPTKTRQIWEDTLSREPMAYSLRGMRTSVPALGIGVGQAYEYSLRLIATNTDFDPKELPVVMQRFTILDDEQENKRPSSQLWSNEFAIIVVALDKSSQRHAERKAVLAHIQPPEGSGKGTSDLVMQNGHWWIRTKDKQWELKDPPAKYGTNPITAMGAYLTDLMAAWRTKHANEELNTDKGWKTKIEDKKNGWGGFIMVYRDADKAKNIVEGFQPSNTEIRRVLGLDDLDPIEYTDKDADNLRKALQHRNDITLGQVKRGRGENRIKSANELVVGEKAILNSTVLEGKRHDIIWSGVRWEPMEPRLRRALGYGPLTDIWKF